MACYKLEEYETALEAFEKGGEVTDAQKNPQYSIWAQKCRIAIAGMRVAAHIRSICAILQQWH